MNASPKSFLLLLRMKASWNTFAKMLGLLGQKCTRQWKLHSIGKNKLTKSGLAEGVAFHRLSVRRKSRDLLPLLALK
jgi:hypothetical protein